jgi:hypothetical protein
VQAHPPRVSTILGLTAYGMAFVLGLPLLYLLPAFVYEALFRTDRLLEYVAGLYGAYLSGRGLLAECALVGICLLAGIFLCRQERRVWKTFQERAAKPLEDELPPTERRVELPPPGNVPPSSVAIHSYRSVVGFLFAEFALLGVAYAAYSVWSDSLFRWPPNRDLRACIVGTALALFILGSILVWRRGGRTQMVVDDLGITLRRRRGTDFVP